MTIRLQLVAFVAASAFALFAVSGYAADTSPQPSNSQQSKMKSCNADATTKNLSGDDRKSFMKTCLSATPAPAAATKTNSQQAKMKSCNADATTQKLAGDARKAYMKTCLSGSAPAAATAPAKPAATPASTTK